MRARREPEDSRAYDAATEMKALGKSRFRASYTGLLVCPTPARIAVFREPNAKLDKALLKIVVRHLPANALILRAASISYADMERIDTEIRRRQPEFRAAGAGAKGGEGGRGGEPK